MQHLQATYEAHTSRPEGPQEAMDVISPPRWNQETSSAPSGEDMEAGTEMERAWQQDEPIIADQPDHHATTSEEAVQQPQASALQRPPRRLSTRNAGNYCEEEVYQCPLRYEQPYGKREGVAISTSRLPGAGRGLFGIRPCKGDPLLFKQANEFVCVYATMQDVITVMEAQATESA